MRRLLAAALGIAVSMLAYGQGPSAPAGDPARREQAYRENNLGIAHLEQYDYAGAVAAFRRALDLNGTLALARLNLAIALLYEGQLEPAAREVSAAAARLTGRPEPHFVGGLIARADNRLVDAAAGFQRVLQLDPGDVGAHVQLGQIRLAEREYAEAGRLFQAALAREPFNATAAYGLSQALARSGDRVRAQEATAQFQRLRDNPAAVTYSSTYLEQGRYAEALPSTGIEPDLVDTTVPTVTFLDVTSSILPAKRPRMRDLALSDLDSDGDLDLMLVTTDGVHVLRSADGRFAAGKIVPAKSAIAAVAGDYDNDGVQDLLVLADTGLSLHKQEASGAFRDVTATAIPAKVSARAAAFADADHDGDLDIIAGRVLLRNNGKGRFADVTAEAKLKSSGNTVVAIVPTDFDNRRDVDLLLLGDFTAAPVLLKNQRDGTFSDVARDVGLPRLGHYTSLTTADVNKDLAPDFFFARADGPGVFAMSAPGARFTLTDAPTETAHASVSLFTDYDNDGLADLFAWTPAGPRLWRLVATRWVDVSSPALPAPLVPDREVATAMAAGDIDGDGDQDLVVGLASGLVRTWRNEGGNRNHSVRVRLNARVSNRSGVGAKVDMRAGSLRHRIETYATTPAVAPADVVFGLGSRRRADVIRVLWPAGIVQAETELASATASITELDRKPSSCPFLYTWNGSRFEFVTDFMGGGELGYWVAPGIRNVPDPDEYVRIRGDQLQAREGRYELRVTNELEEAVFLDRVQLVAVAHPLDVQVHPNEGLRSPQRRQPFTLYTVRNPGPPLTAIDAHGHDVRPHLAARDGRHVDDFQLSSIQGYAEKHALTIDTGAHPTDSRVLLLLTGWTDYAFSSDNVAAHQAGLAFRPPELQARNASGQWVPVMPEIGLPVGRPQTVVVDITPHTRSGLREFRIVTTLRVYWDQILVDRSSAAPTTTARLDVATATLRWRGFSAEITAGGRAPTTYDYSRVSAIAPWKLLPGRYTREGDVRALLEQSDDRFVISAPGDEIKLSFDAVTLAPLPTGWTRTFLLYADGFSKEMNLHSSSPDTLEPLPFHGMTSYPYVAPESYPTTVVHERYRAEYNTRVVARRVPAIERREGTR